MGLWPLAGGGLGISLACEMVTGSGKSRCGEGLPSMLLIYASCGFSLIENGTGSCSMDWFSIFLDEIFFEIGIGRVKILFCDGKLEEDKGTTGQVIRFTGGIRGKYTGRIGRLFEGTAGLFATPR